MNGAAPSQPTRGKYTPRIAGRVKGSGKFGLRRPVIAETGSFQQPNDFAEILWRWLLITLGLDFLAALFLAGGQFLMPATFFGTVAAATLLLIGIANGWALNSVRRAAPTWARDALIAQVFMLFLAGFVIATNLQGPRINWYVTSTAALVLAAAFLWFILLAPRSRLEWTKAAVVVTALFPLAGLLQFWLQNYYLPSTSMPLVDISTELSPQGWSGPIVHLSAKVTVHNRGTGKVEVANSLMRVTAYPQNPEKIRDTRIHINPCANTTEQNEYWCRIANGFDPSELERDTDFRVNPMLPGLVTPTPPQGGQLLYAGALHTSFMMPGETDTFQRDVDIDSREVLLARLSASAIVLTEQRIADIRSCAGERTSAYKDSIRFSAEVQQVQQMQPGRAHYFCQEYDIAPGNFIEKLIGNHPAIQVSTWLDNPSHPGSEYPLLVADFGTVGEFYRPDRHDVERELADLYPMSFMDSQYEYAPTDKPSASADKPPSGRS